MRDDVFALPAQQSSTFGIAWDRDGPAICVHGAGGFKGINVRSIDQDMRPDITLTTIIWKGRSRSEGGRHVTREAAGHDHKHHLYLGRAVNVISRY